MIILYVVASFLIPISIISIRAIYFQLKYMSYPGLRSPIAILFFGSILFQCVSIVSISVPPIYDIGVSGIEKLYMGFMFWTFYTLMREFVFFESLFKTDFVQNNPMFNSTESKDTPRVER